MLQEEAGSPVIGWRHDEDDDEDDDDDIDDNDHDDIDDIDDDDVSLHSPPSWRSQGQEHRPKWS